MFDVKQAEEDLVASIKYLEDHDWLQLRQWDGKGNCCAFGAILLATGDSRVDIHFRERSSNVCRVWYRVTGKEITGYNDMPGRTKAEVLDKFREVLDALRADPDRAMGKEPRRG